MVTRRATHMPSATARPGDEYTGDLIVNQEVGVAATPPARRFLPTPREIPLRAVVPRMRLPNSGWGRWERRKRPRSRRIASTLKALKMATDVRNRRKREEQTRIIRRRVCARFVLDASPWRSVAQLVQVVALSESLVAITPSYDPSTCVLVQTMRQAEDCRLAAQHPGPRAIRPLDIQSRIGSSDLRATACGSRAREEMLERLVAMQPRNRVRDHRSDVNNLEMSRERARELHAVGSDQLSDRQRP